MNQIKLVVVGLLGLSAVSSAEAQCVRRTPTVVGIAQQAAGKVIPMIERQLNGKTWYEPGLGWQNTSLHHVVQVRNNDDAACGASNLAVGLDTLNGSGPAGSMQQGVLVAPGATAMITIPEVLVKTMQPGTSATRKVHACRVAGISANGSGVFIGDCSGSSLTQLNALMGPPLLAINGDTTMPDHYDSLNQPIIVSSSVRNLALNVSALTTETILDITGTICPINVWSGGGFSCISDQSVREIMKCGAGSQSCAATLKPNRLGVGRYAISITATNQADANGIKHGNRLTRILEIVP